MIPLIQIHSLFDFRSHHILNFAMKSISSPSNDDSFSKKPLGATISFSRYPWTRRWFGNRSEKAGARFLKKSGYRILAYNHLNALGELDLIALDKNTLVIVEVRSTATRDFDKLARSIDQKKQRNVVRAAYLYIHQHHLQNIPIRFDILLISWPSAQNYPEIRHFTHAFDLDDPLCSYS